MCSEPVLGFVLGPIWASFRTNSVVVKLGSVGREVLVVVAVSGWWHGRIGNCKILQRLASDLRQAAGSSRG